MCPAAGLSWEAAMASNAVAPSLLSKRASGDSLVAWQVTLRRALKPLASLRLTIGLMVAGIVLIFLGTLSMTELNEWEATHNIFRTWFAWIKFQYLFPKSFFPGAPQVSGGFWFPGGWIIGGLMMINL